MTAVLSNRREKSGENTPPKTLNLPQNEKHIVAAALISATSEMMQAFPMRAYHAVDLLTEVRKNPHGWWHRKLPALRDRLGG